MTPRKPKAAPPAPQPPSEAPAIAPVDIISSGPVDPIDSALSWVDFERKTVERFRLERRWPAVAASFRRMEHFTRRAAEAAEALSKAQAKGRTKA